MRGKSFILGFVLLVVVMSSVSAIATPIEIKTLQRHEVQITAFDASATDFVTLAKDIVDSDEYGDVSVNFDLEKSFNLVIYIKDSEGTKVMSEKYLNRYPPGQEVYVEIAPEWFEFVETPAPVEENVSEEIVEEVPVDVPTEEAEASTSLITGNAISNVWSAVKSYWLYVVGVIVIAGIVVFFVKRKKKFSSGSYLSDNDSIEDAERKLREAQEEIKRLKERSVDSGREEEIKKARQKLIEDEKKLMELRKR